MKCRREPSKTKRESKTHYLYSKGSKGGVLRGELLNAKEQRLRDEAYENGKVVIQAQIPAIVEQEIKQLCKDCKSLEWFAQENQQRKKIEQAERAAMERVFAEIEDKWKIVTALGQFPLIELDYGNYQALKSELLGKGDKEIPV